MDLPRFVWVPRRSVSVGSADLGKEIESMKQKTLAVLQKEVDDFNAAMPVGTMVRYWKMDRVGEPSGSGKTRTPAQILSGHTAVVWIEGCSGCISVSHVEVAK